MIDIIQDIQDLWKFGEHSKKIISDALRDLLPFVQFKKREKHLWRNDSFSKAADCDAILLVHCCIACA